MPNIDDYFSPGLLLAETYFAYRSAKGVVADAVARVADKGFYLGVEISDVAHQVDRRRIGDIVRARDLKLTQWMSMILVTENLNLSSLDERLRLKSVARLKSLMDPAAECGAAD